MMAVVFCSNNLSECLKIDNNALYYMAIKISKIFVRFGVGFEKLVRHNALAQMVYSLSILYLNADFILFIA